MKTEVQNTFGPQFYRLYPIFRFFFYRRALAKVLSLYSMPDKYIKVFSAMYEDNTAVVKVGNKVAAGFVLNQELSRFVFYPCLYGSF